MPGYLTITIAFVGWFYLLFLNNRALKRAEIGRLKDDIIKHLLDSSDWLIEETMETTKINTDSEATHSLITIARNITRNNKLELELIWGAKLTQIELKANLLNKLAGCELISSNHTNSLRNIDFIVYQPSRREIIELTSNFIEYTETAYHHNFFDLNIFEAIATRHKYSVLGAIFGLTILMLFYHVMSIFIINQFR